MNSHPATAIARLVAEYGGPTKLSREIAAKVPYQHIQQWIVRGWASPLHYGTLLPLLPRAGLTVLDLIADRDNAKAGAKPAAITVAGKVKKQRAGAKASDTQADQPQTAERRKGQRRGWERTGSGRRAADRAEG